MTCIFSQLFDQKSDLFRNQLSIRSNLDTGKMKSTTKYLAAGICIFIIQACSSSNQLIKTKENVTVTTSYAETDRGKAALDHFISGSAAESKGDFTTALVEFNEALKYDTSASIFYALAKNYFYINEAAPALRNVKKAVEMNPNRIDYYELLADIYTSTDQDDSASVVLEKMIIIDSVNIGALYKLARIYEKSAPLRAIQYYKKLTDIVGPDWNILLRIGELNEKVGNTEESISTVEQLLILDPSNIQIQKLLMEILERNKKYDRALEVVNDMLETDPSDLEIHERKARLFIIQNKWDEASKEYDYLLNQKNVPFDGKMKIGASYFVKALNDTMLLPVAKKFFSRLDQDTSAWEVKLYLGAVQLLEKSEDADIKLKEAAQLNSTDAQGWIQLGGLLFDSKKYKESVKLMSYCAENFEADYVVNLIYGLGLAQIEKHSDAKNYLEKALSISPNDVNALSAYAFTLNQLKDYNNAIKYLNKALILKPDDVNLLGTLGLIYNSQKNWEECDSTYEKALRLEPLNALINNNYAYSLSERGIQLTRAMDMVNLALTANSVNSSYLDTKGWIYFQLGEYDSAEVYIQKALKNGGDSAAVLEHLGDITFKKGERKTALEIWLKAYNLDSSNKDLKLKIDKGEI